MTVARTTTAKLEILNSGVSKARVTKAVFEVLRANEDPPLPDPTTTTKIPVIMVVS